MRKKMLVSGIILTLIVVMFTATNSCVWAESYNALPGIINSISSNEQKIAELNDMLLGTHNLAEVYRGFGIDDSSVLIQNLKNNWNVLNEEKNALVTETDTLKQRKYNMELDILSRVVYAEAGMDGIPDECQQLVAMVVLNRVNDPRFPNNIYDVVFQKGQYACTWSGTFYRTPNARSIANAKKALDGEVECPPKVLGQAGFVQGAIYRVFPTPCDTVYFCYM